MIAPTSDSAAGSANAARLSGPFSPSPARRPGHAAASTDASPVSAVHSSSVTNGITGWSSLSSRSRTKPSTDLVAAAAVSSAPASAGLASSRYQSQNSSQAK